jgi:hypothetical protein
MFYRLVVCCRCPRLEALRWLYRSIDRVSDATRACREKDDAFADYFGDEYASETRSSHPCHSRLCSNPTHILLAHFGFRAARSDWAIRSRSTSARVRPRPAHATGDRLTEHAALFLRILRTPLSIDAATSACNAFILQSSFVFVAISHRSGRTVDLKTGDASGESGVTLLKKETAKGDRQQALLHTWLAARVSAASRTITRRLDGKVTRRGRGTA